MVQGSTTEASKTGRKVTHFSTPVSDEELEFIRAIESFKTKHDVVCPSWSEVLTILRDLGYVRPG